MSPRLLTRQLSVDAYMLGGWDLAICFALFFQGVLCAQFAHYSTLSKRDSIWLKIFVVGLALMTTLRCCQSLTLMWIQNVTMFADVEAASHMWEKYWVSKTDVMLEATGAIYVQIFFCRRLWVISRNAYVVIVCLIFFILGLVSAVVGTFYLFTDDITTAAGWVSIHLGIVLCGDLLLTGSTVFYLLRHSNASVVSRNAFAITMKLLLWLTIQASAPLFWNSRSLTVRYQSAAPAAMCTLTNFVADIQIYVTEIQNPQSLTAGFITTLTVPQLYAWSAMWTLNSREDIWVAVDNRPYTVNLGTLVFASADSANLPTRWGERYGDSSSDPAQLRARQS
ncbi:hypothetical protein MSAN_02088100 [Mycena sanguinolenta]|uniref:Uncharacterized protein n=1 Tax=Mycena sanguinolenta TaxID=230812 RepID=A0A8H6XI07_9AGAR|nr:hypothetical protein MSAN_02088100 [Mycena sanguinolenta]